MTPQAFVHKWRDNQLKERSFYQEHFLDLCRLIGHATPAETDKTGATFTFEAGAGRGFADVWKQNFFAWEYKGKHTDLNRAYDQLLQYRESLQNPPLLVVADARLIRIHTNFTNSVKRVYELALDDLLDPEKLALLQAVFHDPARLKAPETPEQVTEKAAREFARLAERLRKWGEDPAAIAHFLIRLLFCLFAEDAGLLPKDLFTRVLARTRRNAPAFAAQLRQLFAVLSTGGWFGEHAILHFDGGLFDNAFALELDSDGMDLLHGVSGLDWSSIEPSILGTLFERSLDPGKRAQLGAHYTSREDILLIVEPVLMAPLQRKWQTVEAEARALAARAAATDHPPTRTKLTNDLARLLQAFADELRAVRVLDPACGSGNFLYVALRQLLDLWKEGSILAGELGLPLMMATSAPSPAQLYGIEINEYAHELAQATIWIGYIQWLRENGYGLPPEPILRKLDNIRRMDAILAFDEAGKPIEPEWPEADVVVGNPPFLGSRKMRPTLGNKYCDDLLKLYGNRINGLPDLICYWFERAQTLVSKGQLKRVGLIATQAIRGGSNRQVLDHIKQNGDIFMAWGDKDWILDGATVHVSIVGFDNGEERDKKLDGKSVVQINSDLTSAVDLSTAKSLEENANLSFQGVVLRGPFNISRDLAEKMLLERGNPNGRPNSDVLKQRRTGKDVVDIYSGEYVIDFGIDMPIDQASEYVMPFEYLKREVYPMRQNANQAIAREKWWIHWNARVQMRESLSKLDRYIATPRVAKHRIFAWLEGDILPDAQLVVFARSDEYFFGVLHSKLHELWARRMGTQLRDAESGFRYTSTTTFETFPFPWPPGQEPRASQERRSSGDTFTAEHASDERRSLSDADDWQKLQAIATAARELNEKRERWLNPFTPQVTVTGDEYIAEVTVTLTDKSRTLTNLYNARPTWLDLAHEKLDKAVLDAYGWPHGLEDEEILERLLELNLARSKPRG